MDERSSRSRGGLRLKRGPVPQPSDRISALSKPTIAATPVLFPGIHALVDRPVPHASVVMIDDGSMFGRTVGPSGEFGPLEQSMVAGDDIEIWRQRAANAVPTGQGVGRPTPLRPSQDRQARPPHRRRHRRSGTGSIVIEQLARLGFGRMIPWIRRSSSGRTSIEFVNATWRDAEGAASKVAVAARAIVAMASVRRRSGHVQTARYAAVIEAVAEADIIFGCI